MGPEGISEPTSYAEAVFPRTLLGVYMPKGFF